MAGLEEEGVDLPVYCIKFGETCSERKRKAWGTRSRDWNRKSMPGNSFVAGHVFTVRCLVLDFARISSISFGAGNKAKNEIPIQTLQQPVFSRVNQNHGHNSLPCSFSLAKFSLPGLCNPQCTLHLISMNPNPRLGVLLYL